MHQPANSTIPQGMFLYSTKLLRRGDDAGVVEGVFINRYVSPADVELAVINESKRHLEPPLCW